MVLFSTIRLSRFLVKHCGSGYANRSVWGSLFHMLRRGVVRSSCSVEQGGPHRTNTLKNAEVTCPAQIQPPLPIYQLSPFLKTASISPELVACGSERTSPERRGPRPAFGEGKPVLTAAPRSLDLGQENTGRLPLRSAVEGVSREVRERRALPHHVGLR